MVTCIHLRVEIQPNIKAHSITLHRYPRIYPVPTFAAVTSIPQIPKKQNFGITPYCTFGEKETAARFEKIATKIECWVWRRIRNNQLTSLCLASLPVDDVCNCKKRFLCLSRCNLQSVVIRVPILICWPCLPKCDVMAGMHPRPRFYGSLFLTVFLSGFLRSFQPPLPFSVVARRHLSLSGRLLFIVAMSSFVSTSAT